MKKFVLAIAAMSAAFGAMTSPAFAGSGPFGSPHYQRIEDGGRKQHGDRRWDSGGDRRDVGQDRRWDRREERWDSRSDRRDDRWDRRDDRWDRRWDRQEDRWDRHADRRHDRWDRRTGWRDDRWGSWGDREWRHGYHNGYYYRDSWYYGAPPRSYYGDRYYRPGYRHWERGHHAPRYYRERILYNYDDYDLRRPPHGYGWIREDDDYLMVALATGIIAAVVLSDY